MIKNLKFKEIITRGYSFTGKSIILGGSIYDSIPQKDSFIRIPLKTLNRHGLIAGATGSGKTKTLQIIAEQLSLAKVPVLLMDIKGDLSGIGRPGIENDKIKERSDHIGLEFNSQNIPVEFLSISTQPGVQMKATVEEFGPVLFSKILGLNDTQESIISVLFKFSKDKGLSLDTLHDVKRLLQCIEGPGKSEYESEYGKLMSSTLGIILRKIIVLEQQGAESFFGKPSFNSNDLLEIREGKGLVSVVRLTDIQDKPKLFSTFMLQLLKEIYDTFPEEGDLEKPKLCIFIDEAHLVFDSATETLLSSIETIIKLIRSKGVGIFFVTQNPTDIPENVLGQLGLKIQHSLRAFTAKDRRAIKLASQNYPITEFYDVEQLMTEMGMGEALVTALNEKGIPTPLVHTLLRAPETRMGILTYDEIMGIVNTSKLVTKYNSFKDRVNNQIFIIKNQDHIIPEQKKKPEVPNFKETESQERIGKIFSGLRSILLKK